MIFGLIFYLDLTSLRSQLVLDLNLITAVLTRDLFEGIEYP